MALFDVPFSYYLTNDMTKSLVLHDKNNTVYMFVETYASTNYPGWDLSSTFHLVSGTFCSHAALPSAAPFQDLRLPIVVPSIQNSLWLLCTKVWLICDHYWLDQKALITAMLFTKKRKYRTPKNRKRRGYAALSDNDDDDDTMSSGNAAMNGSALLKLGNDTSTLELCARMCDP